MDKIVVLSTNGYRYRANKEKLIEASDYFRAMFSNNFTEKDKDIINIEDIDHKALHILIHYAETGALSIPDDGTTLALLQTAAMLQFTDVQTACEREVFGSLSCESCLEIYSVTASLGLSNIAKSARIIALWNFRKISGMPHFCNLSPEALIEYLSDPSLVTGPNGEWTVWEAIIHWIEHNDIERSSYLKELLCCLDLKLLIADDISNMLFYNFVSENDEVVQLLECVKKCLLLYKEYSGTKVFSVKNFDSTQTTDNVELLEKVEFHMNCLTRKASLSPSVVGFKRLHLKQKKKAKYSDDEDDYGSAAAKDILDLVPVIYTFNQSIGRLSEEFALTKLYHGPVLCSGYQVCSVGPSVYILGGEFQYGHGNWSHFVWRFSTATRKWIVEDPLPKPRRHHMTCVLDSVIYILGGFGRHRVVQSSVNAYDTESGDWVSCPDMPHCVSHGAVCSFKGRVMVFTQEMQLLTYYPSRKKWSAVPLLSPSKHGYRAALAWKNYIYLIDNCTTKVYKYSPEDGQTVVEYGHFATPPINVCVVDGKIYNFSHDDADNHVIEVLIIDEGTAENSPAQHGNPPAQAECRDDEMNGERVDSERMDSSSVEDTPEESRHIPNVKEGLRVIASKEVWREGDNGSFIFTTKFPAENTFSLGCFPLLKLQ